MIEELILKVLMVVMVASAIWGVYDACRWYLDNREEDRRGDG